MNQKFLLSERISLFQLLQLDKKPSRELVSSKLDKRDFVVCLGGICEGAVGGDNAADVGDEVKVC